MSRLNERLQQALCDIHSETAAADGKFLLVNIEKINNQGWEVEFQKEAEKTWKGRSEAFVTRSRSEFKH
jgi:hypothetical protein